MDRRANPLPTFRFRLLGPFAVERDGQPIPAREVGSLKGRTLLKLLVVERHRAVPTDRIADALWGDDAPARPERQIATLVSRLRHRFGTDVIVGGRGAYRFVTGPQREVDLDEAQALTAEAQARLDAREPALALAAGQRALEVLGRGGLLDDDPDSSWREGARAEADRLHARARRVTWRASLRVGDLEGARAAAEASIAVDPLDEEAHRALMEALRRGGRPAAALAAYERLRAALAEELGVDPAPETRDLHVSILRGEGPPEPAVSHAPRLHPADPGFVGRDPEVAELTKRWSDAVAGRSSFVLIVGEAGIGKTRLAGAVAELARATGGLAVQSRCYEAERSLFLEPVLAAVLSVATTIDPMRLRACAGDAAGTLSALVPDVGRILRPIGYQLAPPEFERRRSFEGVTAFFKRLATDQPVLLVLDDLHNADSSTVELLHHLSQRTSAEPLMVLATVRAEEGAGIMGQLAGVSTSMQLGPLPGDAVSTLARTMGAPDLADQVRSLTRGHTLFVVEVLRELAALGNEGGVSRIPDTLRDAVLTRVRHLGSAVEGFLRSAAILGSAFELSDAAQLLDVPVDQAAALAERALEARLLAETGAGLEFANDLIREIVYQSMPGPTRTERHRRAAEIVQARPETMAEHAAAAGDWGRAAEGWQQAAGRAAGRFANRDAEALLDRALSAAMETNDRPSQARIRIARGRAREALADYKGAFDDHAGAARVAREEGEPALEMQALRELGGDMLVGLGRQTRECVPYLEEGLRLAEELGDEGAAAAFMNRLAIIWANRLRFDISYDYARRALERGRALADDRAVVLGLDALKNVAGFAGDLDTLGTTVLELERIIRPQRDLWLLQWAVFESSFAPMARGQWRRAFDRIEAAVDLNRRTGYLGWRPWFLAHLGWIHRSCGNYGAALGAGQDAVDRADEVGHPWWIAFTRTTLAWTLTEQYRFDAAAALLGPGLEAARRDGAEAHLVRCLAQTAWTRWQAGNRDEARDLADEAEALLHAVTGPPGAAYLHGGGAYIHVAEVALAQGDPDRAERVVNLMLGAAEANGWRELEALGWLTLARCRRAADDPAGAEDLATRAADVADAVGIPCPAWEAQALLAGLSAGSGRDADAEAHRGLAERTVADLAATIPDGEARRVYRRGARADLRAWSAPPPARSRL